VSAIRFFKGAGNNGTHIGLLYSSNGTLLARTSAGFETASGWQQLDFSASVTIAPNTTYIAALFTTSGFAFTPNYFAQSGVSSGSLQALQSGVDGGNGVYQYGSTPAFPTATFQAGNYWVDLVFQ